MSKTLEDLAYDIACEVGGYYNDREKAFSTKVIAGHMKLFRDSVLEEAADEIENCPDGLSTIGIAARVLLLKATL